jgi:hypothetical protein
MRPYHPANLHCQPYGHKRVILLAWIAKLLGVQFKIGGLPFGGAHKPMPWEHQLMAEGRMANPAMQFKGEMRQLP